MAVATLTSKGQTTIPAIVRQSLGLRAGTQIDFVQSPDGRWYLAPLGLTPRDVAGVIAAEAAFPIEEEDRAMVAAAVGRFH